MQWRFSWHRSFFTSLLICSLLAIVLAACGGTTSQGSQPPVKLKFVSWIGGDQLKAYKDVIKRFEAANHNITVDYEVIPYQQLGAQLKARLNAGNAPDVMGLFAGSFKDQFVNAGSLADLSNEPWVSRLVPSAKPSAMTSDGKKVVVMPVSLSAVAVIYNKKVFAAHNLAIPTTWQEFLQVCEKLKQAGVAPITMGAKDTWPLAYIPDTMTIQSVYKDTPGFGSDVQAGKASFAESTGWQQALKDTQALNTAGYLPRTILGTSYQDSEDMLATGKAAMTISGQFSVASAKQTNPAVDLGMFPMPYTADRAVTTYVDVTLGVAKTSKHVEEAKKFLQFFADAQNASQYLSAVGSFSPFSGITPDLDPAMKQLVPFMQASSRDLLLIAYPGTANDTLEKGIQAMWAGTESPSQVLQDMDKSTKS